MTVSPGFRGQYLHLEKGRYNGKEPRYGRVRRCAFFAWASRFAIANEGRPTPDVGEYHQRYSYFISYLSLGIYSIFSGVDLGVKSGGAWVKLGLGWVPSFLKEFCRCTASALMIQSPSFC